MAEAAVNDIQKIVDELNIEGLKNGACTGCTWLDAGGEALQSFSPVDGKMIGEVKQGTEEDYEKIMAVAQAAFADWRQMPAPARGEIVRQIGNELRNYKEPLGKLVSYEMGKSYQEGLGEVQEMIDICDFAVGLSRQLYGLTIQSERPQHRMLEQWQPLGIVGIITAFNFPVAVWSWNAMIALVCGDVVIWKPSEKTPLCAIACHNIIQKVLEKNNVPDGVCNLIIGGTDIGQLISSDRRIPLVSATGSVRMGKKVGEVVAARLGKSLLELGGNNGVIITEHADLDLALRAVLFGAVGTAGQRCTSIRRIIIHEKVYDDFKNKLLSAYDQLKIGDPLDPQNHVGPLIDEDAVSNFLRAIEEVKKEGGKVIYGGEQMEGQQYISNCYVKPCIAEVEADFDIVKEETFAPLVYLMKCSNLEEAIHIHNNVPQGLSSAIFTENLKEAEKFLSPAGSDCGIANVNIGTSGAEIGGAFGGEKETGGGRESGSDSWKAYMRRQTVTINYGDEVPLAQGIEFNLNADELEHDKKGIM